MSTKYSLLATEGSHDQAVIGRLLKLLGLETYKGEPASLSQSHINFWDRLIPTPSTNIYTRLDLQMPRIFTSQTHSVAVYQGGGSSLSQKLFDIIDNHDPYSQDIHAFGLIVDADNDQPIEIAKKYSDKLSIFFPTISGLAGTISPGPPRIGIYVLPDNKRQGTLDSILVDCATNVYPDHKTGAEVFLDGLDVAHKSHWKPFDREKAVVASIVSVIRPGFASHQSVASWRDKWICEQTVGDVPEVAQLKKFIADLLEIPTT